LKNQLFNEQAFLVIETNQPIFYPFLDNYFEEVASRKYNRIHIGLFRLKHDYNNLRKSV
jgi:hypothetical protein